MGNFFERMAQFISFSPTDRNAYESESESDSEYDKNIQLSPDDDTNINHLYERKGNYLVDVLVSLSEKGNLIDEIDETNRANTEENIIEPISEENDKNLNYQDSSSNEEAIDDAESTNEKIVETLKKHFEKEIRIEVARHEPYIGEGEKCSQCDWKSMSKTRCCGINYCRFHKNLNECYECSSCSKREFLEHNGKPAFIIVDAVTYCKGHFNEGDKCSICNSAEDIFQCF